MKRAPGTYGALDNWVLAYAMTHRDASGSALLALATQANFTRQPGLRVSEIQTATNLGERAVQKGLALLVQQGYVVLREGYYHLQQPNDGANADANKKANFGSHFGSLSGSETGEANGNANGDANQNSHGGSGGPHENVVLDGEKSPLKEGKEEEGRKETHMSPKGDAQSEDESLAPFMALWNEHCGELRKLKSLNAGRKTALRRVLRELREAGETSARDTFHMAVLEVASDKHWRDGKYGFDNLIDVKYRVVKKAEAYQAKHPQNLRLEPPTTAERAPAWDMTALAAEWEARLKANGG